MVEETKETTIINVRVPVEKKEEIRELAKYAYLMGFIEKPEMGKLFDFAVNLAYEVCHRGYLEIRDRKEK